LIAKFESKPGSRIYVSSLLRSYKETVAADPARLAKIEEAYTGR